MRARTSAANFDDVGSSTTEELEASFLASASAKLGKCISLLVYAAIFFLQGSAADVTGRALMKEWLKVVHYNAMMLWGKNVGSLLGGFSNFLMRINEIKL